MLDHPESILLLCEGGARFDLNDVHGFTPKGYAVGRRHKHCIQALVDLGCEFSDEDMLNCLVIDAFENNAQKRNESRVVLMECGITESIADFSILPFLYPSPRIGKNVFIY